MAFMIILGCLTALLILFITYRIGVVRGSAKARDLFYIRYYKPLFDRDAKVMREMTAILRDGDQTQVNARLYFENRRLKKKAIILACKYGELYRQAKAAEKSKKLEHLAFLVDTFARAINHR